MSVALLDVNVLLALMDPDHLAHRRTHEWLGDRPDQEWASCAITQNGFVRIVGQPGYPSPVPVPAAIALLASATAGTAHTFWGSTVSITDPMIRRERLLGHRQITDAYLLALAVAHDGTFVTLDTKVPIDVVEGAEPRHLVTL